MDVFERFDMLEEMGLLAHEEQVGHPERPLSEWKPDELAAVKKMFTSWPQEEAFQQQLDDFSQKLAKRYVAALEKTPGADRRQKLELAARCFSESCRADLGFTDFPPIELVFAPGPSKGYYGGLAPDGRIQICTRNLLRDKVEGSEFTSDASFIELVFHEATHKLQSHMADQSDLETPGEALNMRVVQSFYEATAGLKKLDHDVYWQHPFERQAREVAHATCAHIEPQLGKGRGV